MDDTKLFYDELALCYGFMITEEGEHFALYLKSSTSDIEYELIGFSE